MDFYQKVRRAEAEYQTLKAQLETGALTEKEAEAKHKRDLMIQDEQGRWWTIGYETGQWYCYDGEKWVRREAPMVVAGRVWPLVSIAVGWAIGWAIGAATAWSTGNMIYRVMSVAQDSIIPWAIAGSICWAIGGAVGGLITGQALRRAEPSIQRDQVLMVAVGWAIGVAMGGGIGWAITWTIGGTAAGAVGGLTTGLALRRTETSMQREQVLIVAVGWAIGCLIGWIMIWAVYTAIAGAIGETIAWAIGGAIGGAITGTIGGGVMLLRAVIAIAVRSPQVQ